MPANRPLWGLLSRRKGHAATATELYGRLVAQARDRTFYADLGVPDTPEGRLELVMLHVALVLRRLAREGEATASLAQALSERFVTDMDDCLREMGVGDIAVARKVKKAAAALYDRDRDYGRAIESADDARLADLVARHVHETPDGGQMLPGAVQIARYAMATEAALAAAPLDMIIAGTNAWPSPTT